MLKRVFSSAILTLGFIPLTLAAQAAEILNQGECNFTLSGEIELGDSDVFDSVVMGSGCTYASLYLDSPGGDLSEALKIARLYWRTTTVIERDAQCLSACALLFMAGRTCAGAPYHCQPTRRMHRDGVLGFHAPGLDEDAARQWLPVDLAFSHALDVFSTVQDTFSELSAEVKRTGYRADLIPLDLMVRMFRTPPHEFYFIENNDQFYAFDIEIFDDEVSDAQNFLSAKQVYNLCYHLIYSELRGWNYSAFGFEDYSEAVPDLSREDYEEFHIVQVKLEAEEPDRNAVSDQYFLRVRDLSMGPFVSGWCRVSPTSHSGGGYFRVEFLGLPFDSEVTLEDVLEERPFPQAYPYRMEAFMHYSMAYPLRTPVKEISFSASSAGDPVTFVRSYFHSMNGLESAASFWIEERRATVAPLVRGICRAQVTDIHSVDTESDVATLSLTTSVEECGEKIEMGYRVIVDLVKQKENWKIASITLDTR